MEVKIPGENLQHLNERKAGLRDKFHHHFYCGDREKIQMIVTMRLIKKIVIINNMKNKSLKNPSGILHITQTILGVALMIRRKFRSFSMPLMFQVSV